MTEKKRILHKLRITEISAVDNPCQEHARMVIMKRADIEKDGSNSDSVNDILVGRKKKIAARIETLKDNMLKFQKDLDGGVGAGAGNIEGPTHIATYLGGRVSLGGKGRRGKKFLRGMQSLKKGGPGSGPHQGTSHYVMGFAPHPHVLGGLQPVGQVMVTALNHDHAKELASKEPHMRGATKFVSTTLTDKNKISVSKIGNPNHDPKTGKFVASSGDKTGTHSVTVLTRDKRVRTTRFISRSDAQAYHAKAKAHPDVTWASLKLARERPEKRKPQSTKPARWQKPMDPINKLTKWGNPYHDALGHFASAAAGLASGGAARAKAEFNRMSTGEKLTAAAVAAPVAVLVATSVHNVARKLRAKFHNARAMRAMKQGLKAILSSPAAKENMKFRAKVLARQIARNDKLTSREAIGRIRLVALDMKAIKEHEANASLNKAVDPAQLKDKVDMLIQVLDELKNEDINKLTKSILLTKGRQERIAAARNLYHHPNTSLGEKQAAASALSRMGATVGNPNHDSKGRFSSGLGLPNMASGPGRYGPEVQQQAQIVASVGAAVAALGVAIAAKKIRSLYLRSKFKRAFKQAISAKSKEEISSTMTDMVNEFSKKTGASKAKSAKILKGIVDDVNKKYSLKQVNTIGKERPAITQGNPVRDRLSLVSQILDKISNEGINKFNPNHGKGGRFASSPGASKAEVAKEPAKIGRIKRFGRAAALAAGTTLALAAAAWFASPHVFSVLDKINAGPELSPKAMAGIIKYAESSQLKDKASGLVQRVAKTQDISGEAARQKVLKAAEALIALRERQSKAGVQHVPLSAVGRSSGFTVPPDAAKAAPGQDKVMQGLQALRGTLKELKV